MARKHQVTFENVSISAVQDLVTIPGPSAGKIIRILRTYITYTDQTLLAGQEIPLRSRILPATVTLGSGGTGNITPSKIDQGDAACSVTTARTNDINKAATSGTAVIIRNTGMHLYQGYNEAFPMDALPTVNPGAAFVFEMIGAPSAAGKFSGGVDLEEIG